MEKKLRLMMDETCDILMMMKPSPNIISYNHKHHETLKERRIIAPK
jgi:hypothetical protein